MAAKKQTEKAETTAEAPAAPNKLIDDLAKQVAHKMDDLRAEMLDEVAKLSEAVEKVEIKVSKARSAAAPKAVPADGLEIEIIAQGAFCRVCGLMMDGASATAAQGKVYQHPFGQSGRLNGQQCKYRGMKFQSPTIMLTPIAGQKPHEDEALAEKSQQELTQAAK